VHESVGSQTPTGPAAGVVARDSVETAVKAATRVMKRSVDRSGR